MVTRFDHVVIAVQDLDAAISRYQHLGFDVQPGGKHTGRGTHNAIIRFGLDYIELLAVYDEADAQASGLRGRTIQEALRGREEILLGYALATDNIEEEASRFQHTELFVEGPFAMQRMRPDGHQLSWHLFVPGGVAWRRPWPFLIQWDIPDEQRLQIEQPGSHANGVVAWVRAVLAVRSSENTTALYQNRLGLECKGRDALSDLAAYRTTYALGNAHIDLLDPYASGPVQAALEGIGEGLFEVHFAVTNLEQTGAFLEERGSVLASGVAGPGTLLILPPEESSVRLVLTQL